MAKIAYLALYGHNRLTQTFLEGQNQFCLQKILLNPTRPTYQQAIAQWNSAVAAILVKQYNGKKCFFNQIEQGILRRSTPGKWLKNNLS